MTLKTTVLTLSAALLVAAPAWPAGGGGGAGGDEAPATNSDPDFKAGVEAWKAAGQPLEGTCEGQMACSTCHVIVDPADFERLPRASEEEDDLLDLAAHVTRTSRLACQIWLEPGLGELTVRVPAEARDMQGR